MNSLRLPCTANWYCEVNSADDVSEALAFARSHQLPILVLGGGTNLVLTRHLDGLVMANRLSGRRLSRDRVELAAGENWHGFVAEAVRQGIGGFENLALIPGNCGAAPMQNIGAYGLELGERFLSLEAIHLETGELAQFGKHDCAFGYRDSLFKRGRQWCITAIHLKPSDELRADYPGVRAYLEEKGLEVSSASVYQAVCDLRRAKLPDVNRQPNVGSFFKNPVVTSGQAAGLLERYPTMPGYPDGRGTKLSAAWLIDYLNLRGEREGGFSVSRRHALVMVNDRDGSYRDLQTLAGRIRRRVGEEFGVDLEIEPAIYPDYPD